MNRFTFLLSWLFAGLGFLPFFQLHTMTVVIVFTFLWLMAAVSYLKKVTVHYILRGVVLFSCLALVWNEYNGLRSVEAAAGFFALLAVLKLWEAKNSRDGFLFFLIFQLMMISQYLLLESLLLLVFMVISSGIMCGIFMDLQRARGINSAFFNPAKRSILLRIMLTAIGLTIILFFTFPRSTFTLFRNISSQKIHSWTGFSDSLKPGSISEIIQNDSVIFRARFSSKNPSISQLYWHGSTLTETDGFNWSRNSKVRFSSYLPSKTEGTIAYEADLAEAGAGPLFLLSPVSTFKLLSLGHVSWRGLGDARVSPLSNQKSRWRSSSNLTDSRFEEGSQLNESLFVPENIKQWVQSSFPQFKNLSVAQLVSASNKLFNKDFSYSLKPGTYGGDPLVQLKEFLLERRIGICEHFASAQAIILRSFGYPALISVGFHGGDYNQLGDYWIIRGRDAHAWLMYYDSILGWKRSDPTKFVVPSRIENGATSFSLDWLNQNDNQADWFESYRFGWANDFLKLIDSTYYGLNLAFINYDADKQNEFLKSLGLSHWKKAWFKWLSVLLAISGVSVFWLIYRKQGDDPWHRINTLYRAYIKKLQKADLKVSLSVPPLELKQMLVNAKVGEDSLVFIEEYITLKYARHGPVPTQNEMKHLKASFKLAKKSI